MVPTDYGDQLAELYRRRFLQAAAASGALIGSAGSVLGQETEFELDGVTSGWEGVAPSDIEGETNPTLTLEAGKDYTLTWTNADGAPHDFAIEDGEGNDIVGPTDRVREQGATQTIEFTATEEMSEYYCSVHPQSMRGPIQIGQEETDEEAQDTMDVRRLAVRDLSNDNCQIIYTYRKRRALETLLADPEVNNVVSGFISSFEAYDPLADHLDSVSVQGSPEIQVEGGVDEGAFEVTAVDRQVAYGLVDRERDELVGLTLTEPEDVTWTAWEADELGEARLRRILENDQVQEQIQGNDWYPLFKVAESITSARGIAHAGVSPAVLFVRTDDGLGAVIVYLDVRDDEVGEVIDVNTVDRFVEFPPHELARDAATADESALGEVSEVAFEQRPWYTANDGFHRIEEPEKSFDRSGWSIDWVPPGVHGVEITASYNGSPVFGRLDAPVTYTGYNLPERQGENTREWFFPDDEPVFNGDLLFWDIHSIDFGGPGPIGLIEYEEEPGQPEGFRFRTHYHTGATGRESQDFHSGHRFGPYNYDISYDFWGDGTFMPVWRRQGPGFITEYLDDGDDGQVVQHYISGIGMDVTPGTEDGVEVQLFDGNEWTTPEEEFYQVGDPGMIARFSNPDGSETIDIPLDHDKEIVVVRKKQGEIGAVRRIEDMEVESAFYHPAQYVDGESIQGERVFAWLLMEAATGQMPHPAGITSFVTHGEVQLSGYD
jgi:plastocyanin